MSRACYILLRSLSHNTVIDIVIHSRLDRRLGLSTSRVSSSQAVLIGLVAHSWHVTYSYDRAGRKKLLRSHSPLGVVSTASNSAPPEHWSQKAFWHETHLSSTAAAGGGLRLEPSVRTG